MSLARRMWRLLGRGVLPAALSLSRGLAMAEEPVPQAGIRIYDDAEALYKAADYSAAAARYEDFLTRYPQSVRAPNVRYRLGQCYFKLTDLETARRHFEDASHFEGSKIQRYAFYYLGQIERNLNRFKESTDYFLRAYDPTSDPGFKQHVMTLIAESYLEQQMHYESVSWYLRYLESSKTYDESGEIRSRVETLITQKLTLKELRALREIQPVYPFDVLILLAQARLLRAQSEYAEARSVLSMVAERQDQYGEEARKLLGEIKTVLGKGKWKIGCLLPLTGKASVYGVRAKRGVETAFETLAADTLDVEIECLDTQGEAELAVTLSEALASDERVLAVLGPLLSKEAVAACALADKHKLPFLSLAPREGLADLGEYVFRHALTPAAQVQAVVGYATKNLGLTRFAVLYPLEPYGTEMETLFKDEVVRAGGQIVSDLSYPPDAKDFREVIERAKADAFPDKDIAAEPSERVGLFIADYYDTVGLLVPQLAYYELKNFRLLGTSGWNHPQIIKIAGEHAEGSIFVDVFFSGSPDEKTRLLTQLFAEKYGQPPGDIEALAYDSAAFLLSVVRQTQHVSRMKIKDGLLEMKNVPGMTGVTTFLANGDAQKSLHILTIRRGRIMAIE